MILYMHGNLAVVNFRNVIYNYMVTSYEMEWKVISLLLGCCIMHPGTRYLLLPMYRKCWHCHAFRSHYVRIIYGLLRKSLFS